MTWSLECSAAEGTPCYSDSSTLDGRHVQSFLVTSSAAFIEVPATTPTPKTRYCFVVYVMRKIINEVLLIKALRAFASKCME